MKNYRPGKIFKKLIKFIKECKALYPGGQANFFLFFITAIRLYLKGGFKPKEIHMYGLFGSKSSKQNLAKSCSKYKMQKIQDSLNPRSWQDFTANKGLFYKYCQAANIPVPKLYGIFFNYTAGCSFTGLILRTKDDWVKFFDSELPSEFVIKPAKGAYGAGFRIYARDENGFIDGSGDRFNALKIYEDLQFDPKHKSFVIQERLKSHPDITRLSNSENLQTVRIITFIDKFSKVNILHAVFKPIVGNNAIDNFDGGRTGNLLSLVYLDTGALQTAITVSQDGSGPRSIKVHPTTGIPFEGFPLPLWQEACSLAKKAAFQFLPKRTIGWDFALTPKGVFIIEANERYDPVTLTHPRINEFLSSLIED